MSVNYNRDRPFLIVEYGERAAENANTRVKGWMNEPGAIVRFERVSVVDRVKRNSTAPVIIDLIEGTAIRNKSTYTDDELCAYYIGKYPDMIKEALAKWAAGKLAAEMASVQ